MGPRFLEAAKSDIAKAGCQYCLRSITKPDFWYIADGGANSVVEVTPEGLILGDTKNPGDDIETAFLAEIRSISPLPVKYVFNTHPHGDHISHNQYFIDHGATVVGLKHLKVLPPKTFYAAPARNSGRAQRHNGPALSASLEYWDA